MAEKEFTTITRHDDAVPEKSRDRVVDLNVLNPDSDGDGKIKPSEQAVFDTLVAADVNKDGFLSIDEFYTAMSQFSAVQRSRQLFKHALAGVSALFLLQTAVVAVLVVVVAVVTKDAYVATEAGQAMAVNADNNVLGYTEALVSLPLLVAPVLDLQKLYNVRTIGVRYFDSSVGAPVHVGLKVSEVRKYSETSVTFFTETPNRRLEIEAGEANVKDYYHDPESNEVTLLKTYKVCAADVSCSSLKAEAADEDALIDAANAALEAAGHSRRLFVDPSDRRKLSGDCVKYTFEMVDASEGSAISDLSSEDFNRGLIFAGDGKFWQQCDHPMMMRVPFYRFVCLNRYYISSVLTNGIVDDDGKTCDTEQEARREKFTKVKDIWATGHTNLMPTAKGAYCADETYVQERDPELPSLRIYDASKVPCDLRYGKVQWGAENAKRMAKLLPAVEDATVFCGLNDDGICVPQHYARGCRAAQAIGIQQSQVGNQMYSNGDCTRLADRGVTQEQFAGYGLVDFCDGSYVDTTLPDTGADPAFVP
jgi:hypothetical protein